MKLFRGALAQIQVGKAIDVRDIVRMTDQRSHLRLLVHTSWGVTIYPFQEDSSFCCGPGNSSSNACINSTRGSTAPFPVQAGRVIFNRTSGSISPNSSETAAVTVSSTVPPSTTANSPTDPTICRNWPSSSNKSSAVGIGVGVPLGLALLGALGLLWKQRDRELSARKEARAWEEKYDELRREKRGELIGVEGQMHELGCEGGRPNELDGSLVYEVADSIR
ncbi:hypothetical protein HO133_004722 [Letharia lupina]|uniref:Uncharacterized protein n=1 Tax=Letharia lupina TaxID=560253 RepID=A0A8H6FKU4_9LECA|nr:uncharacterized protein HO133_004722 [Letharia lupina]KAF6230380.1 hypothetical protein HO133_004722 [Letharia lupina]